MADLSTYMNDARSAQGFWKRRRAYYEQLREMPELRVLSGPCKGETAFVEKVPFRIGRGHNNQMTVKDPGLAGLHAVISRNGLGAFTIVSANSRDFPLYVRRWGRFKETGYVRLRDGVVLRFGRRGPRVKFRYLGETEARGGIRGLLFGSQTQEELLPDQQVRQRLEQMFMGGRLGEQDRHYVNQASRHLATLRSYRRWLLAGSLFMIMLSGLLIYHRIIFEQARIEVAKAREHLGRQWVFAQVQATDAGPKEGQAAEASDSMVLANDRTARGIMTIMSSFGVQNPQVSVNFVNLVKQEVDQEVERLLRDSDLEGFLDRYRRYHPKIEEILRKEYQLPSALAYVAWIESDYFVDAESEKGALGMWQFMAPTAVQYGLITEKGEDFRQDFDASSRAAARYMSDLLAQFGMDQFMVALLAYNWGPESVLNVYRKNRLWQPPQRTLPFMLSLKGDKGEPALPEESRKYVPRFFAANLIGSDMSFYLGR